MRKEKWEKTCRYKIKPMGKTKQKIQSIIAFERNNVVMTVAGVFFVVIVVGEGDGKTFFMPT